MRNLTILAALAAVVFLSAPAAAQNYPGTHIVGFDTVSGGRCLVGGSTTCAPVGQAIGEVSVTPTVTASSYAAGNDVGGLLTVASPTPVAGGAGRIEEVTVYAKSAQTAQLDVVWCGSQNPTSSTITDKTAVSVAAADFNKCRTIAHLSTWDSFGTVSVATSGQIAEPFALASGTTGYAFLVARGAPTFASTSDLQVNFRIGR